MNDPVRISAIPDRCVVPVSATYTPHASDHVSVQVSANGIQNLPESAPYAKINES